MTHHLHAVVVSYKRPELTAVTVASWRATVTVPHSLIVVDNGSPPDVVAQLRRLDVDLMLLGANHYPGAATNRGWALAPPQTTLCQRVDNDTRYLPGWCEQMVEAFEAPDVAQFGPIGEGDQPWAAMEHWPCGGNSVIARWAYDAGLRYDETPWTPGHPNEDWQLSQDVWARGWRRVFAARPGIEYLGGGDPAYYAETAAARGLAHTPPGGPAPSTKIRP